MRQYRAWHKAEKVMCKVEVINFDKGAFLAGVKPGPDEIYDDQIVIAPDNGRFCNFDEIELLESTGLKDKNGVELYCGDIVKFHSESPGELMGDDCNYETTAIVKFMPSRGFHLKFIKKMDIDYDEPIKLGNKYGFVTQSRTTVLGNIHQNPHLLG